MDGKNWFLGKEIEEEKKKKKKKAIVEGLCKAG